MNAYVTAPITENILTVLSSEIGADAGNKVVIFRTLYGLKSSGAALRNNLEYYMRHMVNKSCTADSDLWLNPEGRLSDIFDYYSYILCYVEEIFHPSLFNGCLEQSGQVLQIEARVDW